MSLSNTTSLVSTSLPQIPPPFNAELKYLDFYSYPKLVKNLYLPNIEHSILFSANFDPSNLQATDPTSSNILNLVNSGASNNQGTGICIRLKSISLRGSVVNADSVVVAPLIYATKYRCCLLLGRGHEIINYSCTQQEAIPENDFYILLCSSFMGYERLNENTVILADLPLKPVPANGVISTPISLDVSTSSANLNVSYVLTMDVKFPDGFVVSYDPVSGACNYDLILVIYPSVEGFVYEAEESENISSDFYPHFCGRITYDDF